MKLKRKYQLLLISAILSVPIIVLMISVLMSILYKAISNNSRIAFHESYAYPVMLILFLVSFFVLAFLYSRSIHSLLKKINTLNETIRELAGADKIIPNKIEAASEDELGELVASVNLLIDRTTFKELELKQQKEMQKELLIKLKHDMNTPLTAMKLQLFYLEDELKQQSPVLQSLNNQIQYIASLTDELNLYSLDTIESSYVVKKEVNINDLLKSLVNKWSYLFRIHHIQLIYREEGEELTWNSNDLWLERLLDNIFQNALRHSEASTFDISAENGCVTLRDNGRGFKRENNDKGLGIYIIDDIVKALHLEYRLETSSEGTQYTLTMKK